MALRSGPLTICVRWAWVPCRRRAAQWRLSAAQLRLPAREVCGCASIRPTLRPPCLFGQPARAGSRSTGTWPRSRANQDQWAVEATYDIPRTGRTRPSSCFDPVRRWDAAKYAAEPWHVEQSVWTFRYGIRAAHTAHSRFVKGQSRFPRFKARHRDRPRFTTADGLGLQPGRLRVAKYGWVALAAPVPGAGPAPAAAGARPGPDTEHHREQGRWPVLVRVGVLRTDLDRSTAGIQQAVGCRSQGGRRGQDRRGRGHRRRDPCVDPGSLPRPAGRPGPPQAPATPVPDPEKGRRPGLGRAGPPARLQDHQGRRHPGGSRPVVPLKQDVLGVRGQ